MIKQTEGIIIRSIAFSESSKILTVITKDYGVINILAKGAKRLKSPLRSTTINFTYGNFHLYYKENKLSILICVDVLNPLSNIQKDIIKISYLNFLSDLTSQVIKQSDDINIYNDYINALLKIEDGFDPMIITSIIELKYLSYLGVAPNLESCANCDSKDIITLSVDKGGFICKNCLETEYIVSLKTIKIIQMLQYLDIFKITKISVSDEAKKEINFFIDSYYEKHTGLYLKTKSFLNMIIN